MLPRKMSGRAIVLDAMPGRTCANRIRPEKPSSQGSSEIDCKILKSSRLEGAGNEVSRLNMTTPEISNGSTALDMCGRIRGDRAAKAMQEPEAKKSITSQVL